MCTSITPNIQRQQVLPPTAFTSKLIPLSTSGSSKDENLKTFLSLFMLPLFNGASLKFLEERC